MGFILSPSVRQGCNLRCFPQEPVEIRTLLATYRIFELLFCKQSLSLICVEFRRNFATPMASATLSFRPTFHFFRGSLLSDPLVGFKYVFLQMYCSSVHFCFVSYFWFISFLSENVVACPQLLSVTQNKKKHNPGFSVCGPPMCWLTHFYVSLINLSGRKIISDQVKYLRFSSEKCMKLKYQFLC